MRICYKVPAEAWRQLRDARWEKLKKANFYQCLGRGGGCFGLPCFLDDGVIPRRLSPFHNGPLPPVRTAGPGVSTSAPRARRGPAASSRRWRGAASSRTHAEQREVQGPDGIMPCMPRLHNISALGSRKAPVLKDLGDCKFETRIDNPRLFLKERREGTSKIFVILLDVSRAYSDPTVQGNSGL